MSEERMETYEEVMLRNEPKNYTVKWSLADGTTESALYFPSFNEAELFATDLQQRDYVENVQILRAGRHPTAKRWLSAQRTRAVVQKRNNALLLNEDAWTLPAGFVDGDADKHGPKVDVPLTAQRPRTDAEKSEWARTNRFDDRTCLWM